MLPVQIMATARSATDGFLYQQVIDLIIENIDNGTLRPGDKLPSLRRMSKRAGVSVPTVRQAYVELEKQRRVAARPKSGFYVRAATRNDLVRAATGVRPAEAPAPIRCRRLIDRVYDGINRPELVPFGIANPCMAKPAARTLHRAMKRVMTRAADRSLSYAGTRGEPSLRRQIAWRYLDRLGMNVDPDDVCITNGGQEALLLALSAVAGAGDVIAIESPTYHGLLELIDSLGMLAIEVETCPEDGVSLEALRDTLARHPVKVCMLSTTLSNPLGATMPEEKREQVVRLIEAQDVVLIEDDVYGDLVFDAPRPRPAQFYARGDRVLTCGSFSKTAAPGYRVGWLLPGRYTERVERLKRAYSCSSGFLQQLTLSDFLASGDYDRYLRSLRPALRVNAERMSAYVSRHFPDCTRISKPRGGSVLWLELAPAVDAETLFDRAIEAGISIAPGPVFSASRRYRHSIRLSFGHPWLDEIERGLKWLGDEVTRLAHEGV